MMNHDQMIEILEAMKAGKNCQRKGTSTNGEWVDYPYSPGFPNFSEYVWRVKPETEAMTDQPNNNAQASVGELETWIKNKLSRAEQAFSARKQAAATFRSGDDKSWSESSKLHPSTASVEPLKKKARLELADREDRISEKYLNDIAILKRLSAVLAEKGKELELLREENKHLTAPTYEPQITKWLSDKESENSRLRQIVSGMENALKTCITIRNGSFWRQSYDAEKVSIALAESDRLLEGTRP